MLLGLRVFFTIMVVSLFLILLLDWDVFCSVIVLFLLIFAVLLLCYLIPFVSGDILSALLISPFPHFSNNFIVVIIRHVLFVIRKIN